MANDKSNELNAEGTEQKISKLELEIRELSSYRLRVRHILQKLIPPYAPTVIAIIAFAGAYRSNLFEVRSAALHLKKDRLEWDIALFQQEKDSLEKDKDRVQDLGASYIRGLVKVNEEKKYFPCI